MKETDSRSSMHVRGEIAAKVERSRAVAKGAGKPGSRRDQSKQTQIIKLLRRPKGATITDLSKATDWQIHSVRAALSRLRKQGHHINRSRTGRGASRYRLHHVGD